MAAASVQSLSTLLQKSTVDDHEEIIKACNAVLKKSKHDIETQRIKMVALLKLDRYEDAIRVIEDGGEQLKERAPLEWSYALYKTGKHSEAAEVAARSGAGRGAKHVEAQAAYRAEDFARAASIYKELLMDMEALAHEENDLRINALATDAQLEWAGKSNLVQNKRPNRRDLEAFETAYNGACGLVARGELAQGQLLLKRAKELCKSSDDLSPEAKQAELLPITVQQLYVAIKLGQLEETEKLAEECNVTGISETSTKKIVQNNLLLVHRDANPYMLHKLFHQTPAPTDGDRLFAFQRRLLDGNSYFIDLKVLKSAGVAKSTSKIISKHPAPTTSPDINMLSVLNAAAHASGKVGKACLKEIQLLLEKRPMDVGLVLTAIQLYVEAGNVSSAISLLESFFNRLDESNSQSDRDVRFNPGLVSVLVALYTLQGRKKRVKSELVKAATHWQNRPEQPPSLLRAAATSLLNSSEPSELAAAGEIFTKLHDLDPTDRFATSGYVASYATTSPSKVQHEVDKLPSVQQLVSGIDVNALEAAGIPTAGATPAVAVRPGGSRKRGAEDQQVVAKKRVRKSRLPKDYDPDKQPDPERWLPLRDRSGYRPKGKKAKQKAADRTQGGIVSEKSEDSAVAVGVVPQKPQVGSGGGRSSKKRGKGKR